MNDVTEPIRRKRLAEINAVPLSRTKLEAKYERIWNTQQLTEEFVVTAFIAPLVVVRRKTDNAIGSLEFQNKPRFFYDWMPYEETD
jgi:hypothetical protein